MPRTPRLEELGLPYHVIVQGIDRCLLFRDDRDRRRFIRTALRIFRELGIEVLAWSLMGNHAHFVLRATAGRLSTAMQRLLGSFAQSYNQRHRRVGRLFRDRFWSRPVEDDDDLAGLIGYVILNPVRGEVVRDVSELLTYPWTSLAELVVPPPDRESLVDRDDVLWMFGNDTHSALRELLAMIRGQCDDESTTLRLDRLTPDGAAALTGRERKDLRVGATTALNLRTERMHAVLDRRAEVSAIRLQLLQRGWTVGRVVQRAAEICGVAAFRVRDGGRGHQHGRARGLVARFAGLYLRVGDAEIARATGVTRQSVSRARTRDERSRVDASMSWHEFFCVPDEDRD